MRPSALSRERLIETASRLFYTRGLPHVGINEVTERAGVARMTLYNNFASKDDLAVAAFERWAALRKEFMEARLDAAEGPSESLAAMFDVLETYAADADFRGCPFINAAVQTLEPGGRLHAVVRDYKEWVADKLRAIAVSFGHPRPGEVAQQWLVLRDGAMVQAYLQGSVEPIRAARKAAITLAAVEA